MEIPYTTQPRPDTGLYNAKVGIWLFLASEVMLFGALFSSYILLRVGALEENWPHGLLNIPIGTFNTAVLIVSSVTVVMAWASLKMKQFGRFKIFQAITVVCALAFLCIKSFEYHDKFTHYEVWLNKPVTVTRGGEEVKVERLTGHLEGNPMFMTLAKVKAAGKDKIEFVADPHHYSEGKLAAREHGGEHQHFEIAVADIKRLSAFVPAHSTYFALYFTLTALHALHVLGGAIVIGFLFGPGSKMWFTDPERFTNRVEVAGLFWHFVDLVWIFLFPVLYLL
jgi:cytochrome c oxidase subunit III